MTWYENGKRLFVGMIGVVLLTTTMGRAWWAIVNEEKKGAEIVGAYEGISKWRRKPIATFAVGGFRTVKRIEASFAWSGLKILEKVVNHLKFLWASTFPSFLP